MANDGRTTPRISRDGLVKADEINRISAAVLTRILGGPGVRIRAGNGNVVISADDLARRPARAVITATLDSDLGNGTYTWTKDKGEGPAHGVAAGTNVAESLAHEVNSETGATLAKKTLLVLIAGKWWFQKKSTGAGGATLLGYPSARTTGGMWGPFQCAGTGMVASMTSPAALAVAGAGINGRPAAAATSNGGLTIFSVGVVPSSMQYMEWWGTTGIPATFANVGSDGIRMRTKFGFDTGTKVLVGNFTTIARLGVFNPSKARTVAPVFPGDFFPSPYNQGIDALASGTPYAGGPQAWVDRTIVSTTVGEANFVTMQIPQSLLTGLFQPGDQLVVYSYLVNTVQPTSQIAQPTPYTNPNGNIYFSQQAPRWSWTVGGIAFDGTG